ncbi:MAG: hypothetical protein DRO87_09060 [Candidatus Thorarchaeota archaeon]|nr:MAG: hypothetical protein DRO87_09060 [Candidatus Thorarchaeota archaeon]RLI55729.1 MAG: hypothetical protein DRP09_08795 [Candidatus Thorarchaeota archaeon]
MNDSFLGEEVGELPLHKSLISKLSRCGIETVADLTRCCERELLAMKGLGKVSVGSIVKALDTVGLQLAEDRYGKKICARHNRERGDTRIRTYFLCENCSKSFEEQALNNARPIYETVLEGGPFFCAHCNEKKQLKMYQWYVCDVCDRVLRSIGRGLEADRGVLSWWEDRKRENPSLPEIEETDQPRLLPVESSEEKAGKESKFDFEWRDDGNILFGVEIKTGRNRMEGGSVGSKMTQFQLDVTDIENTISAMSDDGVFTPAYLYHCQVVDIPSPPTAKYECVHIWWTSMDDLIRSIKDIRERPRETRPAAYIDTTAFKPIDEFVDEIESQGYKKCSRPSELKKALGQKKSDAEERRKK